MKEEEVQLLRETHCLCDHSKESSRKLVVIGGSEKGQPESVEMPIDVGYRVARYTYEENVMISVLDR